ncbi:TOBE domain-containing protein [Rhodoferax sp. OV413]|uniref:TOBE domain-containing protein n=1 Tax=Rhodoferax sp. OV413 TaxID=1855285 RepID=UPI0025E00EE0|nr:TOBE domain-containing protein [Rhodoferax sp. OV413]
MTQTGLQFAQALGHDAADKRLDILKRIGEVGSISEAARGAGVSYKAAWQAVENLSNLAGAALIEKSVGGSGGGGARLTDAGNQLLEAAQRMSAARLAVMAELQNRAGNALSLGGLAGLGLRTSMRNQLPCVVDSIVTAAGAARIRLALPHGTRLSAKITLESAEILGLATGQAVLALCKASAVRISAEAPPGEGLNLLKGHIHQTATAPDGADLAVQLAEGLHIIGFPSEGQTFTAQQQVLAMVDESAVAIAVVG